MRKARCGTATEKAGLARPYSQTFAAPKVTVAFVAGNAGHFVGDVPFGTAIESALLPPESFFTDPVSRYSAPLFSSVLPAVPVLLSFAFKRFGLAAVPSVSVNPSPVFARAVLVWTTLPAPATRKPLCPF